MSRLQADSVHFEIESAVARNRRLLRPAAPFWCSDKRIDCLVDRADAGQAVRADEPVVEVRHRQAGHKGVDPDRQTGELDGERVDVEAINAAAGDLAPQQADLFDLRLRHLVVPERLPGDASDFQQFVAHIRHVVLGKEGAHERLDLVDGSDEEVARSHREVGHSEVEELLPGDLFAPGELCGDGVKVLRQRGDDRALDKVIDHNLRGEV